MLNIDGTYHICDFVGGRDEFSGTFLRIERSSLDGEREREGESDGGTVC